MTKNWSTIIVRGKGQINMYGPGSQTVAAEGETNVELDEFSFVWNVKQYSVVTQLEERQRYVKSPVFHGGPKFNHAWEMQLHPKEKSEEVEHLSINLRRVACKEDLHYHSNPAVVRASYQFAIIDANGKATNIKGSIAGPDANIKDFRSHWQAGTWGHKNFITSADLLNPERKLIVNDTLTIRCTIRIYSELKEKVRNLNGCTANRNPTVGTRRWMTKNQLTSDIGNLFSEPIGSDVTIKTKRRNLKAHKAILMARSPVFATMFKVNKREEQLNTVKITDFPHDVVVGMLEFVYTGETKYMAKRAEELLQIADKYGMRGLKESCEYQLVDNLNKDNAAAFLILAHKQNALYLKKWAMKFINRKKEELLKSQTFCEAMKAQTDTGLFVDLFFDQ